MSVKPNYFLYSLLATVLGIAAAAFFAVSNAFAPAEVQAETIKPAIVASNSEWFTMVPPIQAVHYSTGQASNSRCWLYSYTTRYADSADFRTEAPHCWVVEGSYVAVDKQHKDKDKPTIVVNPPTVTPPQDTPVDPPQDEPPTKDKHDNGNHYGNDKPDNNSHDCKNKHDTACGGN